MRYLLVLVVISSCASYAPKTYNQQCADKGMVLTGVSNSSGSGSHYNIGTNSSVVSSYADEAVHCIVPENDIQRCEVEKYVESSMSVQEYNSSAGTKRFVTGVGYIAFILPGVVAKLVFDNQLDEAVSRSLEKEKFVKVTCKKMANKINDTKSRLPASVNLK